jgi:peroxiredoxin
LFRVQAFCFPTFLFYFKEMPFVEKVFLLVAICAAYVSAPPIAFAQANISVPKTIFRDSDGNLVSNNEFVDIRMANFHIRDQTIVRTLEDGTIEFQLQKVPQEGMEVGDISTVDITGKPLSFSDYRGKVVVLNFWFIGCAVCRAEIPRLNDFAGRFAGEKDIAFVAVTADPRGQVRDFIEKNRFDYRQIADGKPVLSQFVVGGYPKNVVIGKDGRIVYWRSSVAAWDKFESVVRAELAK